MENYEKYALSLTQDQILRLTALREKAEAELRDLQEQLREICPGLDLETLPEADRERWLNLKNTFDIVKNSYDSQFVGLFEDLLRDHLISLGDDPQNILRDAADRITYLYYNQKWTPEEIESFMSERYAPLFADPAEAEDSLRELVRSLTDPTEPKPQRRKPLPPLKEYAVMNTRTVHTMLNNDPQRLSEGQLTQYGFKMESDSGDLWGYAIRQSPKDSKKPPVISYVVLNFQDGADLITSRGKRFTAFDYAVYDAVINKYRQYLELFPEKKNEPLILSSLEIWKTLNGYDIPGASHGNAVKPTPKQLQDIERSMLRWIYTRLRMNVDSEILAHYFKRDCEDWKRRGGILDSSLIQAAISTDGDLTLFRITDFPILGEYATRKKQMLNIPYGMLRLKTSKQGGAVEIGYYLMKRVQMMYSRYRDQNRILFSSLYDEGGITLPEQRTSGTGNEKSDRTQIRRYYQKDREKVVEILKGWTPDHIRGFWLIGKDGKRIETEPTAGKTVIGVEIDLIPELIQVPIKKFMRNTQRKKEEIESKQ